MPELLAGVAAGACMRCALDGLPEALKVFSLALLSQGDPPDIHGRAQGLLERLGAKMALDSTTPGEKAQLAQTQNYLRAYMAINLARWPDRPFQISLTE